MLLAHKDNQTIEDNIVELLHEKERLGPALFVEVTKKHPDISKETFYRILRKLLTNEVLTKQRKIYQLNRHWLQRIYRFSKKHIDTNKAIDAQNILSFEEGDRISYKFKNPNLMAIYWAHTGDMVFETHDPRVPIFVHHTHEWLIHIRPEAEKFFLSRFQEDKKMVYFSISGHTNIDKMFKRDWQNVYRKIGIDISFGLKNTEYINVFGDFIFKVSVSKKFANDIDAFFEKYNEITTENQIELDEICNRKDTTKMVIIRSKKEAEKWRAKFKKYF